MSEEFKFSKCKNFNTDACPHNSEKFLENAIFWVANRHNPDTNRWGIEQVANLCENCDTYLASTKITYRSKIDKELVNRLMILASMQGKHQNELVEEAIRDLLKKYDEKDQF